MKKTLNHYAFPKTGTRTADQNHRPFTWLVGILKTKMAKWLSRLLGLVLQTESFSGDTDEVLPTADYIQHMRNMIEQAVSELSDDHLLVAYYHADLAELLTNSKNLGDAAKAMREAHQRLWHRADVPAGRKQELAAKAIELYEMTGEQEQVQKWRDRLTESNSAENVHDELRCPRSDITLGLSSVGKNK